MNTILLKIHNAKQTVAEAVVVTKDGTPTTVKALKRVNYELIDQATDFAPHHIVTKRVAQDLHVSFEEDGQVTDLVIEGFYDAGDTALIGLAEDGQYYYFIPDTANESDYVTQLAVGDVEGQALGGMPYTAPWWVGATEKAGFPWIGLLAGIGGIIALDDDDDNNKGNRGTDNGNNTNPTPPTPTPTNTTIPEPTIDTPNGSAIVTPSSSQHDCMVIEYFDEADVKQHIVVEKKVEKKGTVWEVTETSVQPISTTPTTDGKTLSIDTQTGIVTIPALAVKDNSKVTAHHGIFNLDTPDPTDKISGKNIEGQVGDNPAQNQPTPPPISILSPVIFSTPSDDGSMSFALAKKANTVQADVEITAPDGTTKVVIFDRDNNNNWKTTDQAIKFWKVEPNFVADVFNAQTGTLDKVESVRFLIPANEVKDHTRINVAITTADGIKIEPKSDNADAGGDETPDTTPPALILAGSTTSTTGKENIELTYNKDLVTNNPEVKRFKAFANGQEITVNNIEINGKKVTIALDNRVELGETIKVEYTAPTKDSGKDSLQDEAGNVVPTFNSFNPVELTAGMYTAKSDMIDFRLIGDVNMIDLGAVNKASLHNVTRANVTDSNNGLFIKGDAGDTITLGTVLDTGSASIQVDGAGQWKKDGTTNSTVAGDDSTYNIWTHTPDGIMLYIDADMTVL